MKYLKKFATEAELSAWQGSSEHAKPNVVLVDGVIRYNLPKLGAYIQHIDGTLYDEEGWTNGGFSNDEANGVAVITAKASFVIAKTDLGKKDWSSNTSTLVDGILTTTDRTSAFTDFAGYDNTQLMLATDTSGAGYSCANFIFPNGDKGYLPALGELKEAYNNKSKIASLMTKIGGTALLSNYYWSSTQRESGKSWTLLWGTGVTDDFTKGTSRSVCAFSALPL